MSSVIVPRRLRALCFSLRSSNYATVRILGRYETCPEKMFRIANANGSVAIREKSVQEAKGAVGYDYTAHDGMVIPTPSNGYYIGPNGFAFRPAGDSLGDTLSKMKSASVIEIDVGTVLPEGMILIREKAGHFSLQTTVAIKPALFAKNVNKFLASKPLLTREEYFTRYPWKRTTHVRNIDDNANVSEQPKNTVEHVNPSTQSVMITRRQPLPPTETIQSVPSIPESLQSEAPSVPAPPRPTTTPPAIRSNARRTNTQASAPSKDERVARPRVVGERAGTRISSFRGVKESWKARVGSGRTEGAKKNTRISRK